MNSSEQLVNRFRVLCLGLPETTEASSWGHPNFRAGKKTFATVEWIKGRPSLAFRLGDRTSKELQRHQSNSFLTPYGRGQWLSIWADRRVSWRLVQTFVDQSYRLVALKRMTAALDAGQPPNRSRL